MAKIEGEIVIGRPADVVFDMVADQRNEPTYNPAMTRSEKLTPAHRLAGPPAGAAHLDRTQAVARRRLRTTRAPIVTVRGMVDPQPSL